MTSDVWDLATRILIGLGAMAAGTGIFMAGMKLGVVVDRLSSRIPGALERQSGAQEKLVDANASQAESQRLIVTSIAADVERQAQIIRLLESVHRDREEIGVTLRTISRKLNQVLADSNAQEVE